LARFLVVLKASAAMTATAMLESLEPVLLGLSANIEHRTPVHLSAMIRGGGEAQRMQLFADVQSGSGENRLELVLLSREAMGSKAPHTRQVFELLLELVERNVQEMEPCFRSDRDGPLPSPL
jgi:hypothetical protein